MPGNKKPRKPKPAKPSGPPRAIRDYVKRYECSHCNSSVDGLYRDPTTGIYQMLIGHDETCPVLRGTLTDAHDAIRAARATGRGAVVIADPLSGGESGE
jgi:hypothetical protein